MPATVEALARRLVGLPRDRREAGLAQLPDEAIAALAQWFAFWARGAQLPPTGTWRNWLLLAGRGFGKTRAGAQWIVERGAARASQRIALVAATLEQARTIMVEGRSGLLEVARLEGVNLKWESGRSRLCWDNGSEARLFSGESPEALRGPEHHLAWADELAKWSHPDATWDNLQMGLRAGADCRALVTTTPRAVPILGRLIDDANTVVTRGRTRDNLTLSQQFLDEMSRSYGGGRLARQELDGDYLIDVEGALFPRGLLERCRVMPREEYERIVVGVDPPASSVGDACGIVVAARHGDRMHVLADASVEKPTPRQWASAVANAAQYWGADRVIAESNQGGEMVESVLRGAARDLPVTRVHARRGKTARAEPIAAMFEAGRAFLAGSFPVLEDELARMTLAGMSGSGGSPDRADAMIWALWALMDGGGARARVRTL
ncbi:DNA-packaging protein [Sphingomicrobium arenosum]|uniref:DNA-packaging protein n=1 Tax=Sphingomicrobium arenosum TaxID=2233861 RepID=UPI00224096AD|nr:terminase family protein [Sphingomicrobium arenosum]